MLAKDVVAAVVPSGDVLFVESAWDVLLRCAYKLNCCNTLCMCASSVCGFWRPDVLLLVSTMNNSQLAFRKFHLLTGLPAID